MAASLGSVRGSGRGCGRSIPLTLALLLITTSHGCQQPGLSTNPSADARPTATGIIGPAYTQPARERDAGETLMSLLILGAVAVIGSIVFLVALRYVAQLAIRHTTAINGPPKENPQWSK